MTLPSPSDKSRVLRRSIGGGLRALTALPWLTAFGLFAVIVTVGGFWETLVNAGNLSTQSTEIVALLGHAFSNSGGAGAGSAMTALVILLVLFFLGALAQGAIIDTIHKREKGMKTDMRAALAVGWSVMSRLAMTQLILRGTVLVAFLAIGILVEATATTHTIGFIAGFIAVLVFSAVSLVAAFIGFYAANAIVIKGYSIRDSIAFSLKLAYDHWLLSLEFAFVFFIAGFLAGIVWAVVAAVIGLPFLLLSVVADIVLLPGGSVFMINIWIALTFGLLALMAAAFAVWQNASWTLLFLALEDNPRLLPFLIRRGSRLFRKRLW